MNERQSDIFLLREFVRGGRQPAFASLVRRHLNLVYATALRKVGDAGGAEEISQNVFAALARRAWQFAADDSVPAWLYKAALLESKLWLRGELRRRRREEAAAEMGTTMNAHEDHSTFQALLPLLDDALLSLREKDRTALLLRYYESLSLREVGAAFGVDEKAAQKRVRSALEKLSEFFKRHGFGSVTVGVTAAVLQHTAASASAGVVSTIVGSALEAAPPVLTGLGLWLARLVSLSRGQTAALCVAVAAVPLGLQLNQRSTAAEEAGQSRTRLLAAQAEVAAAQDGLERLQGSFDLFQKLAAQRQAEADRAAADARAFEDWKQKTRNQLQAPDSGWDDRSLFIRIPKSLLPELAEAIHLSPVEPPGGVTRPAQTLLCLTEPEKQSLESTLRSVADLQAGGKKEIYELDSPASPPVLTARRFANGPLRGAEGVEAEQRLAQMLADMREILGPERWQVLPSRFRTVDVNLWNSALIPVPTAQITARVETDGQANPKATWTLLGSWPTSVDNGGESDPSGGQHFSVNVVGYVNGSAALSAFLPGATPEQTAQTTNFGGMSVPEPVRQRMTAWFREQALHLPGKEKP